MDMLSVMDEYPSEKFNFSVLGQDVAISDEMIAQAIAALPEQKRDIILLAYFLDMTDRLMYLEKESAEDNADAVQKANRIHSISMLPGRVRHDLCFRESDQHRQPVASRGSLWLWRMGMLKILLSSHRPSVKSVAANEGSPVRTTGG